MNLNLIETCNVLRKDLLSVETDIRVLHKAHDFDVPEVRPGQHAEIRANIQLTLRHVEDARMRLGKVIQHTENRPSIYDAAERSEASHPTANQEQSTKH
jgi:hypothetical protein